MDLAPSLWMYDQIEKHAYRTCVDWPATRNETSLIMGYEFFVADYWGELPVTAPRQ